MGYFPQGIDIKSFKIRVSRRCQTQVEGFNGYARPLDTMIRARDYRLYNINNLKLARFTEIFPGAAKTDAQRCGDSMVSSVLTQSS